MKAVLGETTVAEADRDDLISIEGNWYFPPSSVRARGSPMARNAFSTCGISSRVMASPYGPLFTELTTYESSK